MMGELLIEFFMEEIPARMQGEAASGMAEAWQKLIAGAGLGQCEVKCLITPRRIALAVESLPLEQPTREIERKGPLVGAKAEVIDGFCRSCQVTSPRELVVKATPKGDCYFFITKEIGRTTEVIIPELVSQLIGGFGWPKSMRFADEEGRWVRPLKSVFILWQGKVLKGDLSLFGKTRALSHSIYGHRVMGNQGGFTPISFEDYRQGLRKLGVVLDQQDRQAAIEAGLDKIAKAKGIERKPDMGLLKEVTGLVEWPVVLLGNIEERFMALPADVLVASMRHHQKYFAFRQVGDKAELAPYFALVANIEASDGGKAIVAGNERVLRARLSDAEFFLRQDLAVGLSAMASQLSVRMFHAKLGTIAQKSERLVRLASLIAPWVGAKMAQAERVASLAKNDLASQMVGEFPELQGKMGGYYAKAIGEDAEVAEAISGHYAPQGPSDQCPSAPLAVTIALADKIDNLMGFWLIGEKPSGSRDPFALRRAALGLIRLALENNLPLDVFKLLAASYSTYQAQAMAPLPLSPIYEDLGLFFQDRLRVYWRDKAVALDEINAVLTPRRSTLSPLGLWQRLELLQAFLNSKEGLACLAASKRVANLCRAVESGAADASEVASQSPLATLFQHPSESALWQACLSLHEQEDHQAYLAGLSQLTRPINQFLDAVKVNDDDQNIRDNRLALLRAVHSKFLYFADFSQILDRQPAEER